MTGLFLFFLLAAEPVTAGPGLLAPREIDVACDAGEKFASGHESEGRLVADVSDEVLPKKGQGTWKVFKTAKEMQSASANGAPNTQARVWVAPGGVTIVEAIFQSDSGDWAHFVDYCYRTDGTLARTVSTYNTFEADDEDGVSKIRTRHYDAAGKVVRSKQKVLNLQTKKAYRGKFADQQELVFTTLDGLPFWSVVKDGLEQRDR